VVGIAKIKAKWTQYEAQRKLYAEHDIFLADDRIVTLLPKLLGKTFYKNTTKRPVPVTLLPPAPRTDGKRIARAKNDGPQAATPAQIASEIDKAIRGTLVHLTPSTNTAVKVGYASWDARKLAENVEAVAGSMIEKYVPKKWRGVKSIHIKGPTTAALPIWLADELWVDEEDVVDEETAKQITAANVGRKRKSIEGGEDDGEKGKKAKKAKNEEDGKKEKRKKQKLAPSNDDKLDKEIALRRERLKKQKERAALDVADEVPQPTKKAKKSKA
jgi:ribosome biogenesis protein UTP30